MEYIGIFFRFLAVGALAIPVAVAIAAIASHVLGQPQGLPAIALGGFIGLFTVNALLFAFAGWIVGDA